MLMALASTVAISVYFVLVAMTRGRLSDAAILYINYLAVRIAVLTAYQPRKIRVTCVRVACHLPAKCLPNGICTVRRTVADVLQMPDSTGAALFHTHAFNSASTQDCFVSAQVFSFAPLLSALLEGGGWLGIFSWTAVDWAWLVYEGAGVRLTAHIQP